MTVTTPQMSIQIRGGQYHDRFLHVALDADGNPPATVEVRTLDRTGEFQNPVAPLVANHVIHLFELDTETDHEGTYHVYRSEGEFLFQADDAA